MEQKTSNLSSGVIEGTGRRMSKINVITLVAGGVLTGVLLATADFVTANYLLEDEWLLVSRRANVDIEDMAGTGITPIMHMVAANLVIGLLILTTYAGIRPRFGAGPGTAAIASFLIFLPCALMLAGFGGGLVPWSLVVPQVGAMLVTFIAAGCAGAWMYSEGGNG